MRTRPEEEMGGAHLRIAISMVNDAFHNDPAREVARILREEADRIERVGLPTYARPLSDTNGNTCGSLVYEDEL